MALFYVVYCIVLIVHVATTLGVIRQCSVAVYRVTQNK